MSMSRLILPFALFWAILFSVVTVLTVLYGTSLSSWEIVYRQFVSPDVGWQLVEMDANRGVYTHLLTTSSSTNIVSISPNHRYVIEEIVRTDAVRLWFIHDINTGEHEEFLVEFPSVPEWSADSRYVAYSAIDHLTIIDAHNLSSEAIHIDMGEDARVNRFLWVEESHTIRYWLSQQTEPRLRIIHADVTGATIDQTPIEIDTLNITIWSPSGQWLVYRNSDSDSDLLDLLIADVNTGETIVFADMPFSDMGFSVHWSHDEQQTIVAFFEGSNSATLYSLDRVTGTYEQIWQVSDTLTGLYWSPDNADVGVINLSRNNIQSVNFSILDVTNEYAEIQSFVGGSNQMQWSPDSSQVIYTDQRGQLIRLDVEAGSMQPLTDGRFTRWLVP